MDEKLEQELRLRMRDLRDKMLRDEYNLAKYKVGFEAAMHRYRSEIDWIDKVLNKYKSQVEETCKDIK